VVLPPIDNTTVSSGKEFSVKSPGYTIKPPMISIVHMGHNNIQSDPIVTCE